ncbi:hypothetical protein HMI54_010296 [Coelomomyces lativittatus]|nr:hypothetical protein HMI54_010296 [Coelomomyces lativittatus]
MTPLLIFILPLINSENLCSFNNFSAKSSSLLSGSPEKSSAESLNIPNINGQLDSPIPAKTSTLNAFNLIDNSSNTNCLLAPSTTESSTLLSISTKHMDLSVTSNERKVPGIGSTPLNDNCGNFCADLPISKKKDGHISNPFFPKYQMSTFSQCNHRNTHLSYSADKSFPNFPFTPVYSNLRLPNEHCPDYHSHSHHSTCNHARLYSHLNFHDSKFQRSRMLTNSKKISDYSRPPLIFHTSKSPSSFPSSLSLHSSSTNFPTLSNPTNSFNTPLVSTLETSLCSDISSSKHISCTASCSRIQLDNPSKVNGATFFCTKTSSNSRAHSPSFMTCCSQANSSVLLPSSSLEPSPSSKWQIPNCPSFVDSKKAPIVASFRSPSCMKCSTPFSNGTEMYSLPNCNHVHPPNPHSHLLSRVTSIPSPHTFVQPLPFQRMNMEMELRCQSFQLKDVIGHIPTLTKDQYGCRFLQRVLENNDPKECECILNEVLPHLQEVMMNPFGNYLCQKILEYATESQTTAILKQVAPNLIGISLNMHGTRAAQKLVDHVSLPEHIQLLRQALGPYTVTLVKDLNGNHVIQKCLIRLRPHEAQFVFDAMLHHCVDVATHRHGCCVLQRCLDYANFEQKHTLAMEITQHCLFLIKDPFGNYVVQYVLEMGEVKYIDAIAKHLLGQVPYLSTQKFSSNVVEKCIRVASLEVKKQLIAELYTKEILQCLLRDAFANYVVQTSIDHADASQRSLLLECLTPLIPLIRNTPYGRRIINKLNHVL